MSILLYAAGAIVVAIGAAMVGFGVPINEFSFGNTLIIAGTVAMVGGLIILAIGVVVRELRHVAEAYSHAPAKPVRVEVDGVPQARAPQPAAGRVPFPPKPKAPVRPEPLVDAVDEPHGDFELPPFPPSNMAPKTAPKTAPVSALKTTPISAPVTATMPAPMAPPVAASMAPPLSTAGMAHLQPRPEEEVFGAPALPNPDEAPDETPALDDDFRDFEPRAPRSDAAPGPVDLDEHEFFPARRPEPPARLATPSSPPAEKAESNYFDAMWPADPKPADHQPADLKPEEREPSDAVPMADEPADYDSERTEFEPADMNDDTAVDEPRSVPILKSGVVDGMGYTLYVDGSIEAELPQGTLRFASINELRAHLEKTV